MTNLPIAVNNNIVICKPSSGNKAFQVFHMQLRDKCTPDRLLHGIFNNYGDSSSLMVVIWF